MIVVDTSELKWPTQQKLHAALWELQGQRVRATLEVARELAPEAYLSVEFGRDSSAEELLRTEREKLSAKRIGQLAQQAWWANEWRNGASPYEIVILSKAEEALREEILEQMDPRCFPKTDADDIPDLHDAKIIAESIATRSKMLLTSNLRSIDQVEVNEWAKANGDRIGFSAEDVLYPADATLVEWTRTTEGLERWIQAGMLACWPRDNEASAREVIQATRAGIEAMSRGTGGKLVGAA